MKFFIPGLEDNAQRTEEAWTRYVENSRPQLTARRLYSIVYDHEGATYEATVGKPRVKVTYPRTKGMRGQGHGRAWPPPDRSETGNTVAAIIDCDPIYVWQLPPHHPWSNPSFVGRNELRQAVYFDE